MNLRYSAKVLDKFKPLVLKYLAICETPKSFDSHFAELAELAGDFNELAKELHWVNECIRCFNDMGPEPNAPICTPCLDRQETEGMLGI